VASLSGAENQARGQSNVSQATEALTRDWMQSAGPSDLSALTKAKVVVGSALEGTVQNGLDEICNHTGRATVQVAGAIALGLAMRGPAWTRLPALAIAAVGTVAYGQQVAEAGIDTASIVGKMNSHNLEASRQGLKEALGPVLFSTALMGVAGAAGSRIGARLPEEMPQLKMAQTLSLAKDHLSDLLIPNNDGFPPGMSPAYAGGYGGMRAGSAGTGGGFKLENFMPRPKAPAVDNVMQMSSMGGSSTVYGEGISFKTSRGPAGENFIQVDRVPPGRSVKIQHSTGVVTDIASDGRVMVGFESGEGRKIDLGVAVRRIHVAEHTNGLKQFRFNDKLMADLEVNNDGHTIHALLGNGDHMHMLDNIPDGYMHFPHKDGLQTWVEHNGQVTMKLPDTGKVHKIQLPEKLAYIRLLEKADGSKEFRFLNDSGAPVAQTVQLPPTPELHQMRAPDEVQSSPDLQRYIAARTQSQQSLHRNIYEEAARQGGGGGGGSGDGSHRFQPSPWGTLTPDHGLGNHAFRLPTSFERVMAREIAGVPVNIMRGNDLSAPADMELALQGHSWLVTDYLSRLDYQEEVHHNDWY
jgi:hypothetical protein